MRGFDRHLAGLEAANREVFGAGIDAAALRDHIRHALGDDRPDASVRVYVHEADGSPSTMVTVRPPGGMPTAPWKLRSVPDQRSLAHLKRAADFGQRYYQRLAQATGFDEAPPTGPDATISEGTITNLWFFDGAGVIWPAAPALHGITMQLVETWPITGCGRGAPPVRVPDLASFATVFCHERARDRAGRTGRQPQAAGRSWLHPTADRGLRVDRVGQHRNPAVAFW